MRVTRPSPPPAATCNPSEQTIKALKRQTGACPVGAYPFHPQNADTPLEALEQTPSRKNELPPDVAPEQVWRDPGLGQHYKVDHVTNGVAALHRCTPAGRVLNQRYSETVPVERMQTGWELVSGR